MVDMGRILGRFKGLVRCSGGLAAGLCVLADLHEGLSSRVAVDTLDLFAVGVEGDMEYI